MQTIIAPGPPAYDSVDVVHEFGLAFKKRQQAVHSKFEKQRTHLHDEYVFQLEELNKEEQTELQMLTSVYCNWIKHAPPEPKKNNPIVPQKTYWQWASSLWSS